MDKKAEESKRLMDAIAACGKSVDEVIAMVTTASA